MRKTVGAFITTFSLTIVCVIAANFSNLIPDKVLAGDVLALATGGGVLCGIVSGLLLLCIFVFYVA